MGVKRRRLSLAGVHDLVIVGLRFRPAGETGRAAMLATKVNDDDLFRSLVVAWFKTLYPSGTITASRQRSWLRPETDTDYIVTLPDD